MLPHDRIISTRKHLKEWITEETKYYHVNWLIYLLQVTESAILRKHIILLRKTEYYTNTKNALLSIFYRIRLQRLQNRFAIHIPINTCAKGLHIVHVGSILINQNAIVDENCVFHINTALVAGGTNDDAPILGKHVIMGIGAIALGGGKNSR